MRTYYKILALFVLCLGLAACEFGQVEQGRCVAYDASKQTFTMVLDVNHDVQNPSYTGGVMTYTMPAILSDYAKIFFFSNIFNSS